MYLALNTIIPGPSNHKVVKRVANDMLVSTKDYDSSADYPILKSFETQLSWAYHSKCSIGNIGIRPIQEHRVLILIEKQMAVQKSELNLNKHGSPSQVTI